MKNLKKVILKKVIIGDKLWEMSPKMVNIIFDMAKAKMTKQGVYAALLAVEKDGVISLTNQQFKSDDELDKEKEKWSKGGYRCYLFKKEEARI